MGPISVDLALKNADRDRAGDLNFDLIILRLPYEEIGTKSQKMLPSASGSLELIGFQNLSDGIVK
jgi:hypothetical protein